MSHGIRIALAALALSAGPLAAQSRPVELGLDAGFNFKINSPTFSTFGLPIQSLRVGFMASDRIGIEPRAAINWVKVSGEDAFTTISADLGVLINLGARTPRTHGYVRPFAGFDHFSAGAGTSTTQFHLGGGIGVKAPLKVSRMAIRAEGGFAYGFKHGIVASSSNIFALIGFSFFTK